MGSDGPSEVRKHGERVRGLLAWRDRRKVGPFYAEPQAAPIPLLRSQTSARQLVQHAAAGTRDKLKQYASPAHNLAMRVMLWWRSAPRVTQTLPVPPPPQQRITTALEEYFDFEALLETISSGKIRPLKARYLAYNLAVMKCKDYGGRLPCRQQLEARHPELAYWSAKELRAHWDQLLEACDGNEYEARQRFGRLFVALSYRWLAEAQPDIGDFHLRQVANMVKMYRTADGKGSLYAEAFKPIGMDFELVDFAIFWDYMSLYQSKRRNEKGDIVKQHLSAEQDQLFRGGLTGSNVWYGHNSTAMWMLTKLPSDGYCDKKGPQKVTFDAKKPTYLQSGWCFTEAALSALLKNRELRLDLGSVPTEIASYQEVIDACVAHRTPPLLSQRMADDLLSIKKFTNSSDATVVSQIYKRFFEVVAPTLLELRLDGLAWRDDDLLQLVETLSTNCFRSLNVLDLGAVPIKKKRRNEQSSRFGPNKFGFRGTQALGAWVASSPRALTELTIQRCGQNELDYYARLVDRVERKGDERGRAAGGSACIIPQVKLGTTNSTQSARVRIRCSEPLI